MTHWKRYAGIATVTAALSSALGGCNALDRIGNIGATPDLAPITNPSKGPVTLPMPAEPVMPHQASSLWQTGSHSFFPDPRANHVGDIITVDITIADAAQITNNTSRGRTNSDSANLANFFGLENTLAAATGADPSKLMAAE